MFNVSFNTNESLFFPTLRKKVGDFFKARQIKPTGNYKIYIKAGVFICSAVLIYAVLVFYTPAAWLSIPLCVLLGSNLAAIGFNIMHDAAHGSFSPDQKLNNIASHILNVIGGNAFLWKIKHNINHHTYTNISEMDDDIALEPWLRVHRNQTRRWYHRFQHIYWVFLYGITYILWVFVADFVKYFSGKISGNSFQKMSIKEHFIFWISKLFYMGLFIILPLIKVGLIPTLIGYLVMAFTCGFIISIVFQLAHLTECTDMPVLSEKTLQSGRIEQQWAVHEVLTTADFATKNKLIIWLTGGLNFQVEHHLFPHVSHIYYAQIRKFVKETCEQFNIHYNEFPTFISAVRSHVRYLKQLGTA